MNLNGSKILQMLWNRHKMMGLNKSRKWRVNVFDPFEVFWTHFTKYRQPINFTYKLVHFDLLIHSWYLPFWDHGSYNFFLSSIVFRSDGIFRVFFSSLDNDQGVMMNMPLCSTSSIKPVCASSVVEDPHIKT